MYDIENYFRCKSENQTNERKGEKNLDSRKREHKETIIKLSSEAVLN